MSSLFDVCDCSYWLFFEEKETVPISIDLSPSQLCKKSVKKTESGKDESSSRGEGGKKKTFVNALSSIARGAQQTSEHMMENQPGATQTTSQKGASMVRIGADSDKNHTKQDQKQKDVTDDHPIHLHAFNCFTVGKGIGHYNSKTDQKKFNVIDQAERNTIGVPFGGWVAIRFRPDNPGVWFLHCHLQVHTSWGLKMIFLVNNGNGPNESLLPPPKDLPQC
ncbi:laccase-4-like protein [Tanacetum coccineum]